MRGGIARHGGGGGAEFAQRAVEIAAAQIHVARGLVHAIGLAATGGENGEDERKESHLERAIIEVVAMQPRGGDGLKGSLAGKAQKKAHGQDEFPQGDALDQALNELEKKIERVR